MLGVIFAKLLVGVGGGGGGGYVGSLGVFSENWLVGEGQYKAATWKGIIEVWKIRLIEASQVADRNWGGTQVRGGGKGSAVPETSSESRKWKKQSEKRPEKAVGNEWLAALDGNGTWQKKRRFQKTRLRVGRG